LRAGGTLGSDYPSSTCDILDNDLLAEALAEGFADDARNHVDAAARCVRHDQRDESRWIALAEAGFRDYERRDNDHPTKKLAHQKSPIATRGDPAGSLF
jgi:hypothetical protein